MKSFSEWLEERNLCEVEGVGRRDFLKTIGAGALGSAFGTNLFGQEPSQKPKSEYPENVDRLYKHLRSKYPVITASYRNNPQKIKAALGFNVYLDSQTNEKLISWYEHIKKELRKEADDKTAQKMLVLRALLESELIYRMDVKSRVSLPKGHPLEKFSQETSPIKTQRDIHNPIILVGSGPNDEIKVKTEKLKVSDIESLLKRD